MVKSTHWGVAVRPPSPASWALFMSWGSSFPPRQCLPAPSLEASSLQSGLSAPQRSPLNPATTRAESCRRATSLQDCHLGQFEARSVEKAE